MSRPAPRPAVAIITPSHDRPWWIVERCIKSVQSQVYLGKIYHFMCADGPKEEHIEELIAEVNPEIIYMELDEPSRDSGNTPRQKMLEATADYPDIEYVCFVDDDNVIFSHFVEFHVNTFDDNPGTDFSVCQIIHCGPVPDDLGEPPIVMDGIPVINQNVDTLQFMIRKDAMLENTWLQFKGEDDWKNYFADGLTFEKLAKKYKYTELPDILGVHL